jgi:hypothetical protein
MSRWSALLSLLVLCLIPNALAARQWDESNRCPPGTALHLDKPLSYSYCVPGGWQSRVRGLETVWHRSPGEEVVVSVQIKTVSGKETAAPLVAYLKKKGAKIHQATGGAVKYFLGKSGGVAWVKHQYRFGVLLYTMCSGDSSCDSLVMEGMVMARTLLVGKLSGTVPYDRWKKVKKGKIEILAPVLTPAQADMAWLADEYAAGYDTILNHLEVASPEEPVQCYFYPSSDAIYQYTRRRHGFHIGDAGEIHSRFGARNDRQSTGHELTHVITHRAWGEPHQALLGEGVAVAMDLSRVDYHRQGRNAIATHDPELKLETMLGEQWYKHHMELSYAVSGSFVKFLLDHGSVTKVKKLYQAKNFKLELKKQYGWSVEEAEIAWKKAVYQP